MDVERLIELPVAASADGGAAVLRDLRARMHRAVESARRDGATGERLFRRSMAVYAGEAGREHVPEEWFLGLIHREILTTLSSRVSTKRLGHLVDVAAQGAMDGYDLHHRLERNTRVVGDAIELAKRRPEERAERMNGETVDSRRF